MIDLAHAHGVPVLLDGAQAVPHLPVDVQALDCDFYAFSGHKLFGPTGIGVLYGKAALLEAMPPYQGGGDMISAVTFEKTFYKGLPRKFEAGTPNIAGVVGLGAAIDYVNARRPRRDRRLRARAARLRHRAQLAEIPEVRLIGTARDKASVAVVRHRRHPSARHRHHPRPRGHRRARRPPLRAAGHAALRGPGDGARVVRVLQHQGGGRRAGRRRAQGRSRCSRERRPARSLPGSHPRPQQAAAELPRARARRSKADGYNPLCGDTVTVYVDVDGDRVTRRAPSRAPAARSPPPRPR